MSRKLKDVEALPDQVAADRFLGFAPDGAIDESAEEIAAVTELRRAAR
jgi:hypothetical protein